LPDQSGWDFGTHKILGEDAGATVELALGATIPFGGLTEGSDVAAAAVHLTSDKTSFVMGVVLPVDGGRMVA